MKSRTAIISIKDLKADALPALKQTLGAVTGVQSIDFNLERNVAVVEFEGEHTIVDELMRAVLKAGYQII
ncbi:MAG TPA: heavy metal-associated domain-containing protein [Candidatus Binatia bacterium]|jgi:copper chaperone CopZ